MDCGLLTKARVEALLEGQWSDQDRERLAGHLTDPCEACLVRLASEDGDRILAALTSPQASPEDEVDEEEPSFAESHDLWTGAPERGWLGRFLAQPMLALFGAAAAVVIALFVLVAGPELDRQVKGREGPAVEATPEMRRLEVEHGREAGPAPLHVLACPANTGQRQTATSSRLAGAGCESSTITVQKGERR